MFGGNKMRSAWRPTHRWFFTVGSVADANEATEICCRIIYAVAAIQTIVLVASSFTSNVPLANLFDPVLQLLLAWFIHHKKKQNRSCYPWSWHRFRLLANFGKQNGDTDSFRWNGREKYNSCHYRPIRNLQGATRHI